MISCIIPTYNREGMLKWLLQEMNHQILKEFEVVVVNDGGKEIEIQPDLYRFPICYIEQENKGPGAARNNAVRNASYNIVLFIGDDTIPHKNLLWRHRYNFQRDGQAKAVQGYTPWHPYIAEDSFHKFLDNTGLQANWNTLKREDGSWKYEASGYCLTTNFSIDKMLFNNAGGFNEDLSAAAWDDISFGHRLKNNQVRTVFDPGAINYHYHKYDLESFAQRQRKEGYWRLELCYEFPEASTGLIDPAGLREARQSDLQEMIYWSNELRYVNREDVLEAKYNRYGKTLQIASLKGILDRIEDDHPALKALEHIHTSKQILHIVSGVGAIKRGDLAYTEHTIGWLMAAGNSSENWACHCYAGECLLEIGDESRAAEAFRSSIKIAPNDWASNRLEELR